MTAILLFRMYADWAKTLLFLKSILKYVPSSQILPVTRSDASSFSFRLRNSVLLGPYHLCLTVIHTTHPCKKLESKQLLLAPVF